MRTAIDTLAVRTADAPPRAMVLVDAEEIVEPVIFKRGNAAVPGATVPRLMAASFARGIQRGGVNSLTRIRVACPPRLVAVRFALARAATVR